ncbi:MAG: methyl-accepting chemotaxis protein, partial [Tumebacillaceae bacterium]
GVNDLQTAHQLFVTLSSELVSNVHANAYWGENNDALEKKDLDFMNESVLSALDSTPTLSAAFETDLTGKILDKRENAPLGIDAELPKLVQKIGNEKALTGLVQTQQGLQLLSFAKVTDEKGMAPSHGFLFFSRPVDAKFIGAIKAINKSDIVLFDGKTLAATDKFDNGKSAEMFKQVSGQSTPVIQSAQVDGGQRTSAFDKLTDIYGNTIGFLGTETLSATGAQIRADLLKKLSVAAALLLVAVGLLGFYVYNRMTRPLHLLREEMARVAAGDLTESAVIAKLLRDKRTDEIGGITRALVTMTEGLRSLVQRVLDESNLLTDRSREFAASTQEARSTLDLIASTSTDIGLLVERTFEGVGVASSKLITLEQQAQNISTNSLGAVEAAGRMKIAAGDGQSQVERSIDTMSEIKTSSEESEQRVIALQEVAEEIHAIVDRIKAIAQQTGLLALNASIEAARAGEHGRGFSIVAQEVGKLSDEAREATDEIAELVGRIRTSVVDVCQTTGQLKFKLQDGVDAVQSTSTAFVDILRHIDAVEEQIRDIRLEAQKQEAITQEGVQAVSTVRDMASQMVTGVQEASAATEESLSSMHAISENSGQLAELAEELLDDVSKFRLSE